MINICLAFDDNFSLPARVLIASILNNSTDQDAINAVMYNSIKYIKRNWNVEVRTDIIYPKYYQPFLNNPFILHYVSSDKPWLPNTRQDSSLFEFYSDLVNGL